MKGYKKSRVFFVAGLFVVLSLSFVFAASVVRTISPSSVTAGVGETVDVTLTVNLDNSDDQFYILKDVFPAAWGVTALGGGTVGSDGFWRITINNPTQVSSQRYTLDVPDGASGAYSFSGDFGVVDAGGSGVPGVITGDDSLTATGPGTVVRVDPVSVVAGVGDSFSVDIIVDGAVNLFGAQFDLQYDDSILDVVAPVVGQVDLLGPNVADSESLGGDYLLTSGLIDDYFILRDNTVQGVTGSGRIATINFVAHGPLAGVVDLTLVDVKLSDSGSNSLSFSAVDGSVDVGVCGDGSVSGVEQCDDGGLCTGDDATACNTDADCSVAGGVCTARDGDGCSSVCTTDSCIVDVGVDSCSAGELCNGVGVPSADSATCCSTVCEVPAFEACGDCGTGLFNFCDRAECQDSISESCYFIDDGLITNNDIGSCSACAGATCSDYNGDGLTCGDNVCGFSPSCEFSGGSCDVATTETVCNDGIDDEGDGLTDCFDSDCAGQVGAGGNVCCFGGDASSCAQGECTIEACNVVNECVITSRPAGSTVECVGTCQACDVPGGSCIGITADEGVGCNGECTSCNAGVCEPRIVGDYSECSGECGACDAGGSCVASSATEGSMCADPGKLCDGGSCCNDVNDDGVCDTCDLPLIEGECSVPVSPNDCAQPICTSGACDIDVSGCNCIAVDTNLDGNTNGLDLILIITAWSDQDLAFDLDSNGAVDIGDLIYIVTRVGICA